MFSFIEEGPKLQFFTKRNFVSKFLFFINVSDFILFLRILCSYSFESHFKNFVSTSFAGKHLTIFIVLTHFKKSCFYNISNDFSLKMVFFCTFNIHLGTK